MSEICVDYYKIVISIKLTNYMKNNSQRKIKLIHIAEIVMTEVMFAVILTEKNIVRWWLYRI